jgi:Flp pilus assembly pilin Flp
MSSFSRVLKRQAGATPKELFVIAALICFSFVSAYGVVSYGLDMARSF